MPSDEGRAKPRYRVMINATSQGPSLRKAKRIRSRVLGCWGSSSVRPKRRRRRWLIQFRP
ncbi:hypothetical protein D3C78_1812190 [compost metagenome]